MTPFDFRAAGPEGAARSGRVEARGLFEAVERLRADGLHPFQVAPAEPQAGEALEGEGAFAAFNRGLIAALRAGRPLPPALGEIARGLSRGRFRRDLKRIEEALREGRGLSEAVAEHGKHFPAVYALLLRAGEEAGNLPSALALHARRAEGAGRARRALLGSIAYPFAVLLLAAAAAAGFLVEFLPNFLFRAPGEGLPGEMERLAVVAVPFGLFVAACLGAAAAAAWLLRTARGEAVLLRLPLFGRARGALGLLGLFGALACLLRARAPLRSAVPLACAVSGGRLLALHAEEAARRLGEGAAAGEALAGAPGVPPDVAAYLAAAERSGRLEEAVLDLAELYEAEARAAAEAIAVVLHPSAIGIAAAVLGWGFLTLWFDYLDLIRTATT